MNEAEISKLRITIENDAGEATAKLLSLAAAMRAIRDVSKNSKFTGISNLASAIKELMASIAGISNADITRLERMSNAIKNMAGVKFSRSFFNAMKGAAGEARDMSMVLYNNSTGSKRGYAWNSNKRGYSGASFGGYIGDASFGGGGGGGGNDVPPIDFSSLFGDRKKDNGSYGRNAVIFRKIFRAVDAAKKKLNDFKQSIMRIAMYRLIRRGLMLIANAFKEGYQNAVEWSRINNTQLYESFKHLQASSLAMKNALGAALGELLITFEPLLSGLALKIANVANELANMFAYMAGRKEYQRAITDTEKLAAAQEKLNRTLLGFDEINKLNGTHDVSDYFETVNIDEQNAERMEKALKGIGVALAAIAAALAAGKLLDVIAHIRTINTLLTTTQALTTAIGGSALFAGAGGAAGAAGGAAAGGAGAAGGAAAGAAIGKAVASAAAATTALTMTLAMGGSQAQWAIDATGRRIDIEKANREGDIEKLKALGVSIHQPTLPEVRTLSGLGAIAGVGGAQALNTYDWLKPTPSTEVAPGEDTIIEVRITDDKGNITDTKTLALDDIINRRVGHIYAGAVAATR